ncbi:EAL domain-containing protein [Marinobacter salinexigens]|uniref:EAL domain-containing protein n=1 Tax=Marinobacter salinexigens TaxID=2919747 RepID=A0A5B0VCR2_9GAMM|nr:EAL domain-containing protein [Marinobacter salinexigens]KAA1171945.1 EAL domain-containing protein [Marinobacter salinexigens]
MAILKRNLWSLFFLIIFGGLVLLSVILWFRWQAIVSDVETYQLSRAELVHQSVDSVLRTQELVLDVVGRELLGQESMFDDQRHVPLLDNILGVDESLVGFGLALPDGTLVRTTSNMELSKLPNLRTNPDSRASFLQALESNSMVLGRTYFFEPMGTWLIPIRKALRNKDGQVEAVMTAGFQLNAGDTVFARELHSGPDDSIMLYRESDNYVQFLSEEGAAPEVYSRIHQTEAKKAENRRGFEEYLGRTVESVKASGEAVAVRTKRYGEPFISAAIFNDRYQLWTVSETRMAPVYRAFSASLIQYLAIYLISSLVLFKWFRVIDQSERKRRSELLYVSRHDDLTGLLNRLGLLDRLDSLIPAKKPFSLVVINIDNFKGINDRFGLEIGDEALVEFARRLANLVERRDDLARLGSDEFAIVTPNTDLLAVEKACQSLVESLGETIEVDRLRLQVTASIGVATFPNHGTSLSKVIRSAHLALYEAKQNRNSVCVYRSEMEQAYLRRLSVEQRLRYGLATNSLFMVYQPQVDDQHETVGLEALVRWKDEELGFVSPAEFVEVAEQSGLMIPLGRFVLETSIREYSELRSRIGRSLELAINISVIQFRQPDFVTSVVKTLETYDVSPEELILEITETLFMNDFNRVLFTIEQLRVIGIRVSMDDFGTGYSSLSLLRKLPLDELKIDKSFVDNILQDERAANMIRSIIAIAQGHNMELVAEGVEEAEQAEALIAMGCRRFQGYYFHRPMPLDDLRERLS